MDVCTSCWHNRTGFRELPLTLQRCFQRFWCRHTTDGHKLTNRMAKTLCAGLKKVSHLMLPNLTTVMPCRSDKKHSALSVCVALFIYFIFFCLLKLYHFTFTAPTAAHKHEGLIIKKTPKLSHKQKNRNSRKFDWWLLFIVGLIVRARNWKWLNGTLTLYGQYQCVARMFMN